MYCRFLATAICCLLLNSCAMPHPDSEFQSEAAKQTERHSPTISLTQEAALLNEATLNRNSSTVEYTSDCYEVDVRICEEFDWKTRDSGVMRVKLTYVNIYHQESCDAHPAFNDEYLFLELFDNESEYSSKNQHLRLESNGSTSGYYIYPCNVTGSGQDLLISKETTTNGIDIWTYELFTLDNNVLKLIGDDANEPKPVINVKKQTKNDRITITAAADRMHSKVMLADSISIQDMYDWFRYGVSDLPEGDSVAELLSFSEVVAEDINGDGLDELRVRHFLGGYKCWYGCVTTWFAYDKEIWKSRRIYYERLDEYDGYQSLSRDIDALDITTSLITPGNKIDDVPTDKGQYVSSEEWLMWDEYTQYFNSSIYQSVKGDVYRYKEGENIIMESSTDDPEHFEVKGLRVGAALHEMIDKLGEPYNLHSQQYYYRLTDGSWLRITILSSKIARFTIYQEVNYTDDR